jgi:hypothetical protein
MHMGSNTCKLHVWPLCWNVCGLQPQHVVLCLLCYAIATVLSCVACLICCLVGLTVLLPEQAVHLGGGLV